MARRENGFTIIETTLVLAITGLIVAVILAGIGNSLSHQRYTDAVSQALDFFRGQYATTASVVNDRPATQDCTISGITTPPTGKIAGASDCLLLGKLLRSSDGETITAYQVIATVDPSDTTGAADMSDVALLQAAQLRQGNLVNSYNLEWGTRLLSPGSANPAKFSLLVVRTPVTGAIRTYSATTDTASIASLLATSPASQADLRLCIDQTGFFGLGVQSMGIAVSKDATNTTGVQTIAAGECV